MKLSQYLIESKDPGQIVSVNHKTALISFASLDCDVWTISPTISFPAFTLFYLLNQKPHNIK